MGKQRLLRQKSGFESGRGYNRRRETLDTHQRLEIFERIFDSMWNGTLVTDADGYIIFFSKSFGQFLGIDPKDQIGKHCTEVIENTRMHIVAKTGIPEINETQRLRGKDMVVQRIPIKKNGKVFAVFSQVVFKHIEDLSKLVRKLSLLELKVKLYEKELSFLHPTQYTIDSIIGCSDTILTLKKKALNAASIRFPVLIKGESGTGKELFAQAIHHASPRKLHPFIRINCANIPRDLLEAELFGYEKGAFTGARPEGKIGKFEVAHHGSVFLDEIAEMPIEMQSKLLYVLEENKFYRISGNSLIKVDFRLIATTNQNLEKLVGEGRFRRDLFYRLNVIPIHIPPLKERREDIIPLARHFLEKISQDAMLSDIRIDGKAEEALKKYDWPGNHREVLHVMERVASFLEGDTIHLSDLTDCFNNGDQWLQETRDGEDFKRVVDIKKPKLRSKNSSLEETRIKAEKEAIYLALESTNYNKAQAARILGIQRSLLYKKMKKYNLSLQPSFNGF